MSDPIKAACRMDFHPAFHHSGSRPENQIKWIVIHSIEGFTAESAARWFQDSDSRGSAHISVDDNVCYRSLRNDITAWGASGANVRGFHIEQAGFARWNLAKWLMHRRTIYRAAFKAAVHCKRFGIPVRWLSVSDLREGKRGITSHANVSKAFKMSTHTDPGILWPRRRFMRNVHKYFAELSA